MQNRVLTTSAVLSDPFCKRMYNLDLNKGFRHKYELSLLFQKKAFLEALSVSQCVGHSTLHYYSIFKMAVTINNPQKLRLGSL